MSKQLECRIVITHIPGVFSLGMFDPSSGRYEALGTHPATELERVVGDLRTSIERAGHRVTYSEWTGSR